MVEIWTLCVASFARYEEERRKEAEEFKRLQSYEVERQAIIEEERQRLLKELGPEYKSYLPKGTLEKKEDLKFFQ